MDPIQAINTLSQVVKSAKLPYNDHVLLERCVDVLGKEIQSKAGDGSGGTMSGKMVFLDFSSVDGVPNIQLVAKGADGFNRNYIKKYIPGMVNPYDQQSMLAANGDDSFTCQIMSESGVIVRNPLSCGILNAVHA